MTAIPGRQIRLEEARRIASEGRIAEAIEETTKLVADNPDYFDAYGNLAYWLCLVNDSDQAIPYYEKCCELAPHHPEAFRRLGFLYLHKNNYEGTIRVFEKFLEITPNDHEVMLPLGNCYITQNRIEEATKVFEELLQIVPNSHEVILRLSDCYLQRHRKKEARRILERLDGVEEINPRELEVRFPMTSPTWRSLAALARSSLRTAPKRMLNRGLFSALGSEILAIPKSMASIKKFGLSLYLRYLESHYFIGNHYTFLKSPCDYCGSENFRVVFFHGGQKKVKCEKCGLECVERKPPESHDVEMRTYDSDLMLEKMEKIWEDDGFMSHRSLWIHRVFEEVGLSVPSGGSEVFEFGCAQGQVLEYFARRGASVRGIETSEKLTHYCQEKKGLRVERNTVRGLQPESETDLVLAFHVLEHLDRPSDLFIKSRELLKEGGHLLIEVPLPDLRNHPLSHQLNIKHGYVNEGHLYYFQPETLVPYFEKYGFELVNSYQYHVDYLPSGGFLGRKTSSV